MSHEPEREIEKTLRAAAQQRRDAAGAPPAMHPATRALLQGEVARAYPAGRSGANPGAQKFRCSWPKLAAVAGMLLLLGLVVSFFLPGPDKAKLKSVSQLAKNESADTFKTAEPATRDLSLNRSQATTGTAPASPSQDENQPLGFNAQTRALKQERPPADLATLPAAKPMPAPAFSVPAVTYDGTTPNGSIAAAASPPSDHVATLQFARVAQPGAPQRELRPRAGPNLLNTFRVEQTGDQLRVIDSDGSIYAGYVEKAETDAKTPASRTEDSSRRTGTAIKDSEQLADNKKTGADAGAATNTPPALTPQSYFFRVSGANLTLHQEIVFTGHFVGDAAIPAAAPPPPINGAIGGESPAAPPAPLQLLNCRVSGRAVIDSANQVEINAQATTNGRN